MTTDRVQAHRLFFAKLVAANAGLAPGSELESAFASTPREQFVGPPPWRMFTRSGYIESPDDPALLYQDVVVSLGGEGPFNNGQPTLHAYCIAALRVKRGERIVHVGAGTGYYTAIMAKLVGDAGTVDAYEIIPEFARRAVSNLAEFPFVTVQARSGAEGLLPACDVLYVNAGATEPLDVWLDALRPGGRLLFPMTPSDGTGAMLLVTKNEEDGFAARFLMQVQFVPCLGARNEVTAERLGDAFRHGGWNKVKSLRRNEPVDGSCWVAGEGWWLSTT
ncbi:MAG: protein-L-isoaspartate(D-aspartate) O-methyltransferase [Edaphobacter sp.]